MIALLELKKHIQFSIIETKRTGATPITPVPSGTVKAPQVLDSPPV